MKVSVRTVDRYISTQKLSHERRDGRIWLDKKEIQKLKSLRRVDTYVDMSTTRMSMDKVDIIPVDMSIDEEGNAHHSVYSDQDDSISHEERPSVQSQKTRTPPKNHSNEEAEFYKKMYEQLQGEIKEKEQRLEMANYRVGQLEGQIKETVPLLEYKRDIETERLEKQQLRKTLDNHVMELGVALNNFREENFNKRVYLILLFILLLLQPLWFLFPPK